LAPDHAPDAVHVLAFADDHVNVATPPLGTVSGATDKVTVGSGAGDSDETASLGLQAPSRRTAAIATDAEQNRSMPIPAAGDPAITLAAWCSAC
jgi:hypothetical protein